MKSLVCCLLLVLAISVSQAQRLNRDIGLHHNGGAASYGDASSSRISSTSASSKGYGRDVPTPPLSVALAEEAPAAPAYSAPAAPAPAANSYAAPPAPASAYSAPAAPAPAPVTAASVATASSGYPKENPSNPLKYDTKDAQAATKVEVSVESEATTAAGMMMSAIPGNPGEDYPVFDTIPETSFSCKDQATGGYYADVDEGRCQVFHICHDGRKFSFLCPNGTLFDQRVFVCNWWNAVDCAASKDFYNLNAQIGVVPESSSSTATAPEAQASIVDTQTISRPNSEYLPPAKEVQKPADAYLPPSKPTEAPAYAPPPISQAVEAAPAPAPAPATEYLPPVTQPVVAAPAPAPATEYLPPVTQAVEAAPPAPAYVPPPVAPNAQEAITNGIISTTTTPALSYLPPNSY